MWRILGKLRTDMAEDAAIPLFNIYSKDSTPSYRDTCSFIFIAALFIIGRNQKECGYSSTAEWIMMMWCIYTMGYYLTV